MSFPYQIFDVFADAPLAGNPLAVVFDADRLSTEEMQSIAREFNLSETVFFSAAEDAGTTARMRIFTPVSEMPFAGHPTVGGAIAYALARGGDGDGDAVVRLALNAGPVAVKVTRSAHVAAAAFDAPLVPKSVGEPVDTAAVAAALGLAIDDIGFDGLVPIAASSGPTFTMVPLARADALARIAQDRKAWASAFAPPLSAAFCVARSGPRRFQARMFAPLQGIEEDPATGSAAVAFAALLAPLAGGDGVHEYVIDQGVEMGRPSVMGLALEIAGGSLVRVQLSGQAVKVAEGTLLL